MNLKYLIVAAVFTFVSSQDVVVRTEWGNVTGHVVELANGNKINSFLAIPYAKPPVGNLRFLPPVDPEKWDNFVADSLGAACPQDPVGFIWFTHPGWNLYEEDCLNLNIFAPNESPPASGYPVMVYIHGGGYVFSANVQFPCHFLADKGVIVVAINYRLGHLGFMSTGDNTVPGNMGLLDQRKAMEFVKQNIKNFGGNPDKITLFGESAGASSVDLHTLLPESRDLFHQMIQQSGTVESPWGYLNAKHKPEEYTEEVAGKLNCSRPTTEEMMDCLRLIDHKTLREASFTCKPGLWCVGFGPVIDGDILPRDPVDMIRDGDYKKCPLLSGIMSEDGVTFIANFIPELYNGPVNGTRFDEYLENIVDYVSQNFPSRRNDLEALFKFYYRNWDDLEDGEENRQTLIKIATDSIFGAPFDRQAKVRSTDSDVYKFIFSYKSNNAGDIIPEWFGVPHVGEIPYVFGYPLLEKNPQVRQDMDMFFDFIEWDELDVKYADYVATLWTNFAKYGDPTPSPVSPPVGQVPTNWLNFTKSDKNYLFMGQNNINNRENYRQQPIAFWDKLIPYFFQNTSGERKLNHFTFSSNILEKKLEWIKDHAKKRLVKKLLPLIV
ncbi:DgyrCDS792 [Dimorphilus gyrociliatus]|uniref:Carboxylic ester hydrolase n=1 Tax=Dimorphilus gyrociliatus TaxID=2664684 RepID=A0A7I8V5P4_9ANNE|nr:DgyrCDS792 [Dimorphilus gyrociliatus]